MSTNISELETRSKQKNNEPLRAIWAIKKSELRLVSSPNTPDLIDVSILDLRDLEIKQRGKKGRKEGEIETGTPEWSCHGKHLQEEL